MNMLHIYVTCGTWGLFGEEWRFTVDEEKRGRLLNLQSSTSIEELKMMVLEDYGVEPSLADVEFSYLPTDLSADCPPVVMTNDRQVKNFTAYLKNKGTIRLCVSFKPRVEDQTSKVNIDLNEEPDDLKAEEDDGIIRPNSAVSVEEKKSKGDLLRNSDADAASEDVKSMKADLLKKGQHFRSKEALQATMKISAMISKFDYRVTKSDQKIWSARCVENVCNWRVRAECLERSTYFKINKYVAKHSCAPSKFCRTPSARTVGQLIMHKYEGVKEGPKPNNIINLIRTYYGCELTYSQAWESREYAINEVRGIQEKSYGKIPKYLHMLREVNPGTYTNYVTDCKDRFLYLFLSFGQSIRGFYKALRKVIVVDGTFFKSKYKGVLLVATAIDGNSNLYPIAFGIADTENDRSWEWFFMQLKVVIADEASLSFVSDRHPSILKSVSKIYPLATQGICIHHLLNNVITQYKGKGLAGLIAKASKAYRVAEFERIFNQIYETSPAIGRYLLDADVKTWARCHFPGYRYDINTNNPAESLNAALKSPREYPIIPLLDSIRELMTRWFYERRTLSGKHNDPLTVRVEKKVDRRIGKGAKFKANPITDNRFHVIGDVSDYVVDLERRTCSCGKFDLSKIPCRHAIKGILAIGKETHHFTDEVYSTFAWRTLFEEPINPIGVPEDEWCVPDDVKNAEVLPPETWRGPGRRRKRRYETIEDKIRSSQGGPKRHKCSRCGKDGHNRATCDLQI